MQIWTPLDYKSQLIDCIMGSFHLDTLIWLVKRLTHDLGIENSPYNEANNPCSYAYFHELVSSIMKSNTDM